MLAGNLPFLTCFHNSAMIPTARIHMPATM